MLFDGVARTQDTQTPAEVVHELLEQMGYFAALQTEGTDEAQTDWQTLTN